MARPERIESLDDVFVWIADHAARSEAYWEAQHSWNSTKEYEDKELGLKVTAIEKKVMWVAGVASTLGAGGGATVASFLIGG